MNGDKPLIAIFTPTYNRADLLHRCYASLCRQTSKNFEWYIIDDGSTDGTADIVKTWGEDGFKITYVFKENGGLHTGYNTAIELIDNLLLVCIDSDDWMPDNAVETIEKIWLEIVDEDYVGIMGIDCYATGEIVGDKFPPELKEMYLWEKTAKYSIAGDKKMVYRTEFLKKVAPMPTFNGEKNFNPSYLMYQVDQYGPLYITNACLCVVEYQPDGMSGSMLWQYRNSPNSFIEIRKQYLSFPATSFLFKLRHSIHLASSCFLAGRVKDSILSSPNKMIAILVLPLGWLLSKYILIQTRKGENRH